MGGGARLATPLKLTASFVGIVQAIVITVTAINVIYAAAVVADEILRSTSFTTDNTIGHKSCEDIVVYILPELRD